MSSTSLTFAATGLVLVAALLRLGTADDRATALSPTAETSVEAPASPLRSPPLLPPPATPGLPTRPAATVPDVPPVPSGPVPRAASPATTTSPEGFAVVTGTGEVVGDGRLSTFTIEVEPATGVDVAEVQRVVEAALLHREHGWVATGAHRLQRVADPATADIRVVVATAATVDRLCARVGLRTNARFSCWDGRRALLNADRWQHGAATYGDDLAGYRAYLVSHEVGHGLGHGHRGCPGAGRPAPVMMQQTKALGACTPNPWPVP